MSATPIVSWPEGPAGPGGEDPEMGTGRLATLATSAAVWRSGWHERWRQATPSTRARIQVGSFFGVVFVAYHYSLATLVKSLDLDTPLAYIGLVPFIALGLAAVRSRPSADEPAIHDRQLDYIIGLPLLAVALAINLLLPRRMSAMFWVWRIDLLSFPVFVAGVAAVTFGVRAMWRQRLAIVYLFLAWPVPYSVLLMKQLAAVTDATIGALHVLLRIAHVGTGTASADGSVFTIVHNGRGFPLSVVSSCSGVNGMVGFLLVGAAFAATVRGPRRRKSLWLLGGLLLLWCANLCRLLFIFWVGQEFGEHLAITVLHPFIGLVTFNLGVMAMLLLLRPLGLRIAMPFRATRHAPGDQATGGSGQLPRQPSGPQSLAIPTIYSAVAVVILLGVVFGLADARLSSYDLVAKANGDPKLASFLLSPAAPAGWKPAFVQRFDWAKPYFGERSSWYRYSYGPTLGNSDLHSRVPVVADVVSTDNLSSFSAYGVEACYRFHGYSLRGLTQVGLGGGITGQALSYEGKGGADWSIVYWIWPVRNGASTRYERVILYVLNPGDGAESGSQASSPEARGRIQQANKQASAQLTATRGFLTAFARQIVTGQAAVTPGSQVLTGDPPSVSSHSRPPDWPRSVKRVTTVASVGTP